MTKSWAINLLQPMSKESNIEGTRVRIGFEVNGERGWTEKKSAAYRKLCIPYNGYDLYHKIGLRLERKEKIFSPPLPGPYSCLYFFFFCGKIFTSFRLLLCKWNVFTYERIFLFFIYQNFILFSVFIRKYSFQLLFFSIFLANLELWNNFEDDFFLLKLFCIDFRLLRIWFFFCFFLLSAANLFVD